MKIEILLHDFLKETGRASAIKLGKGVDTVLDEQKNKLIDNMIKESKFNKNLIIAIAAMFVIIFFVGVFFAYYYRDSPTTLGVIFGGSFLTMISIIKGMQTLWEKKAKMDMLMTLIPGITPEQTIVVIETLLFYKENKK